MACRNALESVLGIPNHVSTARVRGGGKSSRAADAIHLMIEQQLKPAGAATPVCRIASATTSGIWRRKSSRNTFETCGFCCLMNSQPIQSEKTPD